MTKPTKLTILSLSLTLCFAAPLHSLAYPVMQETVTAHTPDYDQKLQQALKEYTIAKSADEKYGILKRIATLMNEDIQAIQDSGKSNAGIKEKEQVAQKFITGIQQNEPDEKNLSSLVQNFIKL